VAAWESIARHPKFTPPPQWFVRAALAEAGGPDIAAGKFLASEMTWIKQSNGLNSLDAGTDALVEDVKHAPPGDKRGLRNRLPIGRAHSTRFPG
jgi:hypothetical protein